MDISNQELEVLNTLSKLESLQLNNCKFSNEKKVRLNLKNLIINKCDDVKISVYDDIKTLKR